MAAISVASRVAEEMGCIIGEEVGYCIRFDQKLSSKTIIKYCTDGILLRETLKDPLLSKYSVIIIDEVHERSLNTDILLGLLKKIMKKRNDLRIIITSATLNAEILRDFFETNIKNINGKNTSCILSVEGRQHPVDIQYLIQPNRDYIKSAIDTVINIHKKEREGDVLVFLPGAEEIDRAIQMIEELFDDTNDITFLPLYSSLPISMQMKIFTHIPEKRKVIFATNIAETSITIGGIKFVVDAARRKEGEGRREGFNTLFRIC
jgi:ATP-dependent RNA helicase DDX35